MKRTTLKLVERKQAVESKRVAAYGPPPTNVFKQLRESQGLSHDELAKKCGVSKQALIRLEQGTFNDPLPRVVDYYVREHGYSELWLIDDYEQYQLLMRKRHNRYFGLNLDTDPFNVQHPLRQLRDRNEVNPTEVAKALCIPQATLLHFERKFRQQQSVPKLLMSVLREIGYTDNQVREFCNSYQIWRKRMMEGSRATLGVGG